MLFRFIGGVAAITLMLAGLDFAAACSRVLWSDNGQAVVVGRNMDWFEDMRTDLWAFPRGIARTGLAGDNSIAWTSKYGSVAAAVYDIGTADGINEKGLVANLLWLAESDYGPRDVKVPGLSISLWVQYALDNFASVAEVVAAAEKGGLQLVPVRVSGSANIATVHLSLSDASGDSAIIEIVDGGKASIHHSRAYTVMTNSPVFEKQLANQKRYQGLGGAQPLPGTSDAADRFVRAAFYVQNLTRPKDRRQAYASLLSVMRNVSQPFVKGGPDRPEASHTIWRTVADATGGVYLFESTLSPNIVWVRLDGLNFSAGVPVRKLDLVNNTDLVGDVTAAFKPAAALAFVPGGL